MFDTLFQKKTLYASITGLFLGLILLGCPFFVSAGVFNEDFNGYAVDSYLDGQGGWTRTSGTGNLTITDTYCLEGFCAVSSASNYSYHKRTGSPISDGSWTWYWYRPSTFSASNYIKLWSGGTPTEILYVQVDKSGDNLWVQFMGKPGTNITLYNDDGLFSTWFSIYCEWENLDQPTKNERMMRCRLNNLPFSDWIETRAGTETTGRDVSTMEIMTGTGSGVRVDFISSTYVGECTSETCSSCNTSESCLSTGDCIWEYAGAGQYQCHAPFIAYVYGCGLGECGCLDQGTCEGAEPVGTCEWVDKGYGIGCYEVLIAPPEAEWEAPTLEECGALSGVEKWLCEIKNFIAGLFMPTQEKVDDLKKTIGNFKTKFPFNYANSLSAFFQTIRTSLDTPKDIPVEILGKTGNVNFNFLNATGTIGGTSETFKDMLYDFTTALIIFAFVLWIVSFIKRIF